MNKIINYVKKQQLKYYWAVKEAFQNLTMLNVFIKLFTQQRK